MCISKYGVAIPRYKKEDLFRVDIDYPEGGAAWIDHDLPMPTVVIINPENFHVTSCLDA